MDPRTRSHAGSLLWIRNPKLEQFCIWHVISLEVWNTRLASRPLSVVAGIPRRKWMGGLIICVLMVFCENEKLDVSMFTEPPDGLLEPKKHERRTCVARGACNCLHLCRSGGKSSPRVRDENESYDELPVLHILRLLMLRRLRPLPSLLLQNAWVQLSNTLSHVITASLTSQNPART